jgi:hypothetical protein
VIANSHQASEQRLRLDEVGCVEPFGEPTINRCEQIAGFVRPALVAPQPGEPGRGAQFERLGLLPARDGNRFPIRLLRGRSVPDGPAPVQITAQAKELSPPPTVAYLLGPRESFLGLLAGSWPPYIRA